MEKEIIDNSHQDVTNNWVSTSRFIWLCQIFLALAFVAGCSFNLYTKSYKGKPDVKVPENTLYNPKYK